MHRRPRRNKGNPCNLASRNRQSLGLKSGYPIDVSKAVTVGKHGIRRSFDTGSFNGEHFAVIGGIEVFKDAKPDDGILELAIVTAKNPFDLARTLNRVTQGGAENAR